MSVKSKHSLSKKDKNGKKDKKKKLEESDEEIESSEEELDLTKECHPIGHYINDRAEMINQMFSVIRGNKLRAMLPPILKDYDSDQLKLLCLDQLLGMSEKRITCILEGGTLETSSESEVAESDEYDSSDKNGTTSDSSTDGSEGSLRDGYANNTGNKHKKRKRDSLSDGKGGKIAKSNVENAPSEQGKTLLEILELEMRARAIRALLKQSSSEKGNEQGNEEAKMDDTSKNGFKDIASEVVDLTECEEEEFPVSVKKDNSEENDIDKKVSTFERKIEKSKTEKSNSVKEDEKSKRLQAEFELRNKLFKKKIYRTRQQRMESEEEEKNNEVNEAEIEEPKNDLVISANVVIKKETVDADEIVLEDPEEGEISTSEDELSIEIKQEVIEPEQIVESVDFEPEIDKGVEKVTAIDNGAFVSNCNLENPMEIEDENIVQLNKSEEEILCSNKDNQLKSQENEEKSFSDIVPVETGKNETENRLEETSWRDRWLQKDGVQKLVKSSKIYAKVKKRIAEKSQKAKEEIPPVQEANSDSNSAPKMEVIEGSIKEYESLLGKVHEKKKSNEINENGNSQSEIVSKNSSSEIQSTDCDVNEKTSQT